MRRSLGVVGPAFVALVIPLVAPGEAWAIKQGYGTEVVECGYPMMVGVNGNLCQGTYIGGGLVVTAGHCVDQPLENPADISFGDGGGASVEQWYDDVECTVHTGSWAPDLAVCDLSTNLYGISLPATPVVYPTPPDGCEVNYLRQRVSTAVTGCSPQQSSCTEGIEGFHVSSGPIQDGGVFGQGPKRWTESVIIHQQEWDGHAFMLHNWASGETETNMVNGDSGAPFYMRMPDGSWRVLAVHSGRQAGNQYSQAIPPYYAWIQNVSTVAGYDITPCHKQDLFGQWVYDAGAPNCQNQLMMAADEPSGIWGGWCYHGPDHGGGAGECAGWLPGYTPGAYTSPFLPGSDYDDIVAEVEDLVLANAVRCSPKSIAAAIRQEGELVSGWPFLGPPPTFFVELYTEASYDADDIYNDCK